MASDARKARAHKYPAVCFVCVCVRACVCVCVKEVADLMESLVNWK